MCRCVYVLMAASVMCFGCQRTDAQQLANPEQIAASSEEATQALTVEVVGVYRDPDVEFVVENLKEIFADSREWGSSGAGSGNRVTFEAKTLLTSQAVADKINFGIATQIHGRHVRVIFDQAKQVPDPARSPSSQLHEPAVDPLGPALDANGGDYVAALKSIGASVKIKNEEIVELRMPAFKTNDATLALVAKLPSLKQLELPLCRDVTDKGARHLAKLSSLEYLNLFGTRIGNPGQAHLSQLKKLRYLGLSGLGTEQGLEHLSELTNLETLKVGYGIAYPVSSVGLRHLSALQNLRHLRLEGCEIDDDGMEIIAGFHQLTELLVQDGTMTSDGLAHLSDLTQLTQLSLQGCNLVDDRGIAHLRGHSQLKSLDLSGTQISDQSLSDHIVQLHALTYLSLAGTKITDNSIQNVSKLSNLYSLSFADTAITDAGIIKLSPLARLHQLIVNNTAIGDDSARHIASFPELKRIWACDTQISDRGLKHLGTIGQLQELQLNGTRITDAGMKSLSDLIELRQIAVKDTAVTLAGLRKLKSTKLYQITVDQSQASWEQIQSLRSR